MSSEPTLRRHRAADNKLLRHRRIRMRRCKHCVSRGLYCVVPKGSDACSECQKTTRECDLAPPSDAKFDNAERLVEDLNEKILQEQVDHAQRLRRLKKLRRL